MLLNLVQAVNMHTTARLEGGAMCALLDIHVIRFDGSLQTRHSRVNAGFGFKQSALWAEGTHSIRVARRLHQRWVGVARVQLRLVLRQHARTHLQSTAPR